MVANIADTAEAVSVIDWAHGLNWYAIAKAEAKSMAAFYGIGHRPTVAIIAAASARTDWASNLIKAEAVLANGIDGAGLMPSVAGNIRRIIERPELGPSDWFGPSSAKVRDFDAAIWAEGAIDAVPIDSHNYAIALGLPNDERPSSAQYHQLERADTNGPHGLYRLVSSAFRIVAIDAGMAPARFAAGLWCHRRGRPD